MTRSPDMASPAPTGDDQRLAPLFVAIVFVEILTIAALYWFGRHFS